MKPHIQIVPKNGQAAFVLCHAVDDNTVSSLTALLLPASARAAWLCPACARRFRERRGPIFIPALFKPKGIDHD